MLSYSKFINEKNPIDILNEGKDYKFQKGDQVTPNKLFLDMIIDRYWPKQLNKLYGKIGTITVVSNNSFENYYTVRFEDGFRSIIPESALDPVEIEKPKIRWYKNGKLEEKLLLEISKNGKDYKYEIGDRVTPNKRLLDIIEERNWPTVMYKLLGQVGTIKHHIKSFDHRHVYFVKFDKSSWNMLEETLDPVEIEEPKIRWYRKGKLEEKLLLEASKDDIGRIVKIRDDSEIYSSAFWNNGDGYGVIKDVIRGGGPNDFVYYILWNNQTKLYKYRATDIEFVDNQETPKVRWYRKGKFENDK